MHLLHTSTDHLSIPHNTLQSTFKLHNVKILILQIRKLKYSEIKLIVQFGKADN